MFHKGEHERQFAYVAGTACYKRNFILGFSVSPGNVYDSVMLYIEQVEDYRHAQWGKDLYNERKQKIERVFADFKVKHGLRYMQLRGLAKVTMQATQMEEVGLF